MAGRSAAVAALISGEDISGKDISGRDISGRDMAARLFLLGAKEKPRRLGRGFNSSPKRWRSVALAEQLQQQREQVDEVQIQRQGAGDGRALRDVAALRGVAIDVVVLQPLGVVGGEACEY